MTLDNLDRSNQGHNTYIGIIYMLGHFTTYIMAIYADRKLCTVPCDILTLNDLDFGLNHKYANMRQFVYIKDIYEIICGEYFDIMTFNLR